MSSIRKKRFTLIEMLSVVAVIGILMGILLPVIAKIKENGRKIKAKTEATAIATAIKAYEQTYGVLPLVGAKNKLTITEYRILMEILTGVAGPDGDNYAVNSAGNFNARKIRFLDVPSNYKYDATGNASGTTTSAKVGDYMDPWNNIYQICIDEDDTDKTYSYDNIVFTAVTSGSSTPTGALKLNGSVFVYSIGPNKEDNKGKNKQFGEAKGSGETNDPDDICSWR